jgi:hypothetical protein
MKTFDCKLVVVCALTAFAAGCAGAKVSESQQMGEVIQQRPAHIVVYPFAVDSSDVTLNQSIVQKVYRGVSGADTTTDQQQLGHETAQNLCVEIAADLSQKGYPAACQQRGTPPLENSLIIDGMFTNISEGNRIRRMAIGFGAGASTMDASLDVYQHADGVAHEVLQFNTHADSGKMPGLAVTGAPGLAIGGTAAVASTAVNVAAGGAKAITSSTGYMAKETAKQVEDEIGKFYSSHGWAPPEASAAGG